MVTRQTIKEILKAQWPEATIGIQLGRYEWLHHDATNFENRTAPAFYINLNLKTFKVSERTSRRIYDRVEFDQIAEVLRRAGICAEIVAHSPKGNVVAINLPANQWPVNQALGLGSWHNLGTAGQSGD